MPNDKNITIPIPGEIDGDPHEVEALVTQALYHSMDAFADWIDQATKQLANTERTRILTREPGVTAEELAEAYDESARAGQLARLNGAARALASAAAELTH